MIYEWIMKLLTKKRDDTAQEVLRLRWKKSELEKMLEDAKRVCGEK